MPTQDVKRARITALVLGSAAIVSIVFFLYANEQKSRANQLQSEVDSLKQKMKTMKSAGDSISIK